MSWRKRLGKASHYLKRGDLGGLGKETIQFLTWIGLIPGFKKSPARPLVSAAPDADHIQAESRYWAQTDWDRVRRAGWGSPQCFGPMAVLEMTQGTTPDINRVIAATMQSPRQDGLRGLVLGCGDMKAEHSAFIQPGWSFAEIDAYDVNEQAFEQAHEIAAQAGLRVNLHVADVNRLVLPTDTYHLIVVFHSYHHFELVERVAWQINQALAPGGVFYTFDYIGPRRLQYTRRQLSQAQLMLEALPEHYRRELNGRVRQQVQSVPVQTLSPNEAIQSDKILAAFRKHLCVVRQYNWAGLLYPLLEGIAFNFDEHNASDRVLLDYLFNLDKVLCRSGQIEPNFTITVATKKGKAGCPKSGQV